jgi:ABC-type multidrug transport system ATPase subunit
MIQAEDLVKVFAMPDGGEKRAVDGLSFSVGKGRIYGLLGPNGAGKTTTLRILSGLIQPDSGWAAVNGYLVADSPMQIKNSIGLLTANTGLYQRLSPRELLSYFADLHDLDRSFAAARISKLISWLQMDEFADLRCGSLSTGQRQRTSIARALVADPPILIMDEPTLGLDVLTNRLILDFIAMQKDLGKTVLLCTHHLAEAESLCDMIGLIHRGRLVAEGTLDALREQFGEQRLTEIFLRVVRRELAPTVRRDV